MTAYHKGVRTKLSAHFDSTEFDCRCKFPDCRTTQVDPELIRMLEGLRASVQMPLEITSGYRCAAYQTQLRGSGHEAATVSQHCYGKAADVRVKGLTSAVLQDHAIMVGFQAIGFARSFIHLDTRRGRIRRWQYV